jgi:hypothetical protein
MNASKFLLGALACGFFASCGGTIYTENPVNPGSPGIIPSESYKLNFRNAVAEGATAEEAHRRALLVAGAKARWD